MEFLLSAITKLQSLALSTKITLVTAGVIVVGSATTVIVAITIINGSRTQTETLPTVSGDTSETTPEYNTSPKQDSIDIEEKTADNDNDASQYDESSQNKNTSDNVSSITNSSSGTKPTSTTVENASNNNSCTIQEYGITLGAYSRQGCNDYLKCEGLWVAANGETDVNYYLCFKDYPDYACNRNGKTSETCIEGKMIGWSVSAKPTHMNEFIRYQSSKLQGRYSAPHFIAYNMPTSNVFKMQSAGQQATDLIVSNDNLVVEMCASEQNGVWTVTWGAYEHKLTSTQNGVNNYVVTWTRAKDRVKSGEKIAIDNLAKQYQSEIQQWQNLYVNNFLSWYH